MPSETAPAPTIAQLRTKVARMRAAEATAYATYWRDLTSDDEAAFQA